MFRTYGDKARDYILVVIIFIWKYEYTKNTFKKSDEKIVQHNLLGQCGGVLFMVMTQYESWSNARGKALFATMSQRTVHIDKKYNLQGQCQEQNKEKI